MFFDDALRIPRHSVGQPGELSEDLYNAVPNDDVWRKIAVHTPPYSPPDQSFWKPRQAPTAPQPSPVGLQVVPDDWPAEELSSDLPLLFSDAEFERLKSSTLGNDPTWPAGEVSDFEQSLESQQVHVTGSDLLACAPDVRRLELKPLPALSHSAELPLRNLKASYGSTVTSLTTQDAVMGHQTAARWNPYPGNNSNYILAV